MKRVNNPWVWRLVFWTLITGLFVIGTFYTINFYFSVRGTTEIVIGGEDIVRQLEQQDPELAILLRILALSIALAMNVFEIVGVLGDIYWEELKSTLDIFGNRNDGWVRPSLRTFYVTIFALDVATNLLGLPRPTGVVHGVALFLTAVFLSTIEYPFLWWFLPFLTLWQRKKPTEAAALPATELPAVPTTARVVTEEEAVLCACGRSALPGYKFCERHAPSWFKKVVSEEMVPAASR